jgi:hypothetical protein
MPAHTAPTTAPPPLASRLPLPNSEPGSCGCEIGGVVWGGGAEVGEQAAANKTGSR